MNSNRELPVLSKTHKFLGFILRLKNEGYISKFELIREGMAETSTSHYSMALTWDNIAELFKVIEFLEEFNECEIRLLFIDETNNHHLAIPFCQTDTIKKAPPKKREYFEDLPDEPGSYWEKRTRRNEWDVPGGYFDN